MEAASVSPEGSVWSYTRVHVPIDAGEGPVVLVYVDLDAGARVLCHGTHEPAIGQRVRVIDAASARVLTLEPVS
jgi:uncharacterized OB-fold protein